MIGELMSKSRAEDEWKYKAALHNHALHVVTYIERDHA